MQKITRIASMGIAAGALALLVASPSFAWHPVGVIKKEVQNVSAQGTLSDASSAAQAVAAKPGDLLKYVITVGNAGDPHEGGYNDMAKTVMTDELPAGIELIANPAQRKITENLGTIKPGQSITKEYMVKVTSTADGALIKNQACFTGDSAINDNPQAGCDGAHVKINVPPTTPELPKDDTPAVLPETGPEAVIGGSLGASALLYGTIQFVRSKRNLLSAHKR